MHILGTVTVSALRAAGEDKEVCVTRRALQKKGRAYSGGFQGLLHAQLNFASGLQAGWRARLGRNPSRPEAPRNRAGMALMSRG